MAEVSSYANVTSEADGGASFEQETRPSDYQEGGSLSAFEVKESYLPEQPDAFSILQSLTLGTDMTQHADVGGSGDVTSDVQQVEGGTLGKLEVKESYLPGDVIVIDTTPSDRVTTPHDEVTVMDKFVVRDTALPGDVIVIDTTPSPRTSTPRDEVTMMDSLIVRETRLTDTLQTLTPPITQVTVPAQQVVQQTTPTQVTRQDLPTDLDLGPAILPTTRTQVPTDTTTQTPPVSHPPTVISVPTLPGTGGPTTLQTVAETASWIRIALLIAALAAASQ